MSKSIEFYGPQTYLGVRKSLLLKPHIISSKVIIFDENNNQITFNKAHNNYFKLFNNKLINNSNEFFINTIETGTSIEIHSCFNNLTDNLYRLILKNNKLIINLKDIAINFKNDIGLVIKTTLYYNAIIEFIIDETYLNKLERFIIRVNKNKTQNN